MAGLPRESGEGAHYLAKQFELRCMLGKLPAKQKASAHGCAEAFILVARARFELTTFGL